MPSLTELATRIEDWEENRNLTYYNTPQVLENRLIDEVTELQEAEMSHKMLEAADVLIFTISLMRRLAHEQGLPIEAVEQAVMHKMQRNEHKYDEDFFNDYSERAISRARHFYNSDLPEGNDIY